MIWNDKVLVENKRQFFWLIFLFQAGYMFNMSPEKFSEIAENLDPVKPLNVSQ